jgi:hypothetical protein
MERLATAGWLERLTRGGGEPGHRVAAQWSIPKKLHRGSPPPIPLVSAPVLLDPSKGSVDRKILAHDAFRLGALGDRGWQVLRWLSEEDQWTPRELGSATGISERAVRESLRQLERFELARHELDGWLRVPISEMLALLDAAAASLGTAGALEQDQEQYERDRNPNALFVQDSTFSKALDAILEPSGTTGSSGSEIQEPSKVGAWWKELL